MRLSFYTFVGQCLIIYNNYNLMNVNALLGENIRHPNPDEYLFVVSIVRVHRENNNLTQKICIGTILSRQDVLTAAHCLDGEDVPYTVVGAGSIDYTLKRFYSVLWWITYEWWMSRFRRTTKYAFHDVAVLRLLDIFPRNTIPAPISQMSNKHYYQLEATIATWTKRNPDEDPTIMDLGDVTLMSEKRCAKKCKAFRNENKEDFWRFLCSSAKPPLQLENGDSGGPLFHEGVLIGINNGFCPPESSSSSTQLKYNIHSGMEFYKRFIEASIAMP